MSHATRLAVLLCGAVALLGTACGGGGGDDILRTTLDLPSIAAMDGSATGDGILVVTGGSPMTGDLEGQAAGRFARQFYTFDRSALPAGVTIESATLRLYQADVSGDPYTDLGAVIVDYVDYGATFTAADYHVVPIASVGTLSTGPALGWRALDVTASAQAAIGAGSNPQYRLDWSSFAFQMDMVDDFVRFTDQEDSFNGAGFLPVLRIVYRP